ncbi:uncharacterized protein LOC126810245 isoform X2 [Patella vulgata]|uniref:uncharacterized protein LOC126810245 isoform X2 n=1 Tax=Patella vulgata TaxID=6465 RepID=UPI0024A9AC1C|nr:uncharacterized protein LOC126810245 isoform X2 [Patella vulgata]XP_055954545.1 uncharacterized protein LOC126810245 isoform X2 [Patella vulgata]
MAGVSSVSEYPESSPDAKRRKVITRREKGKMLPEDNLRIISNYVYLTENLAPLQPLLDSLYEKQVLNEDDLEKIRRAESRSTKAMIRQFLDILRTCGINAYSKFIHCLNEFGYGAVAEQLASDIDMDGIVEREEKESEEDDKYLQLQERLQQIKQEKQISEKENQRIKMTLNSLRLAVKTKTNIFVRFKSEMRTKTKLLDQLKEERDSRNEDLQMTKVRNSILCDELDRIYEQNVIIDRIKEEIEDDDNGQGINDSGYSPVDIQATDGKLLVKQEPLDVNETDDIDCSLPPDDKPLDGITTDDVKYSQTSIQNNNMATITSTTSLLNQPFVTQDVITTNYNKTTDNNIMDEESIRKTCLRGTLDEVNNLIQKNINVNIPVYGLPPIFYCVQSKINPMEKVKLLYSAGAMLNVKDNNGRSILHHACWYSTTDSDCIQYLLEQGLDKDGRDDNNKTPVFYCILSDKQIVEKLKLLYSAGAMLDVKSDFGSLLEYARLFGNTECESYLREIGLDK